MSDLKSTGSKRDGSETQFHYGTIFKLLGYAAAGGGLTVGLKILYDALHLPSVPESGSERKEILKPLCQKTKNFDECDGAIYVFGALEKFNKPQIFKNQTDGFKELVSLTDLLFGTSKVLRNLISFNNIDPSQGLRNLVAERQTAAENFVLACDLLSWFKANVGAFLLEKCRTADPEKRDMWQRQYNSVLLPNASEARKILEKNQERMWNYFSAQFRKLVKLQDDQEKEEQERDAQRQKNMDQETRKLLETKSKAMERSKETTTTTTTTTQESSKEDEGHSDREEDQESESERSEDEEEQDPKIQAKPQDS
jgi:hypothetical protein